MQRDIDMQAVLDRVTYEAHPEALAPIPWPKELAPTVTAHGRSGPDALPKADVLVVTWTAAEFQALADVLTPGCPFSAWGHYTKNWSAYLAQLTDRSPAKEAQRLGEYALTKIGTKHALCFHSQLHLATDGLEPPIVALWQQIIGEVDPELVITTGTAGGIGTSTCLGDVFVVSNAKFNCTKDFKDKTWAQERFEGPSMPTPAGASSHLSEAQNTLMPVNAGRLEPEANRNPHIGQGGDVETVDYFGFADTDDTYGVVKNDPLAHTEEMDDATLPLALSLMSASEHTPWLSIRNASDPQVPSSIGDLEAQKHWASQIYEKYGYWTTVGSAIACWAVIADLN
jgi:nucleoside phosphorylase